MGLFSNIFGSGDTSHTNTTSNMVSYLASTTINSVTSNQTDCNATINATQTQTINVGTDTGPLETCLKIPGVKPSDCATIMNKGLSAYGITQSADIKSVSNCSVSNDTANKVQADLANQIDQKMAQSNDDVGSALNSLVTAFNKTSNTTTNTTTSSNFVTQNFSASNLSTMMSTIAAQQTQTVNVGGQNNSASDIQQMVQIQAMTSLLNSNSTTANALTQVSNSTSQDLSQQNKGLTDIVSSLTSMITSALSTLTAPMRYMAIGLCVCLIVCCIMAPMLTKSFGDAGGFKTIDSLGSQALSKVK